MGLDKINILSFPIAPVHFSQQPVMAKSSGKETGSAPIHREESEEGIKGFQADFVTLQKINDNLNELAKIQKGAERRFAKVDRYLEQMKEELERIIKQFPPFPPGSEDRVKALRAFTFFRKLTDQLTLPLGNEALAGFSEPRARFSAPDVQEEAISLPVSAPQTSTNA